MSKKRKLATLVATTGLLGAVGIGSTLAYFTDNDAASNIIETGKVDISLLETKDNGNGTFEEVQSLTFENVMPGDFLAKDPFVRMEEGSADAYLRIKLEIVSNTDTALTEKQSEGIWALISQQMADNNWTLGAGDYYYYQGNEGVATASTEDARYYIFQNLDIPTEWDNDFADLNFNINITAEATQAKNFENNLVKNENGIYAWDASELDSVAISFDGAEAVSLVADANGNVTLPASTSDGWYDAVNLICYKNGATVNTSDLEGVSSMTSVAIEDISVTIKCHDTADEAGDYFAQETVTISLPKFDADQKAVYVDVNRYIKDYEGYTTSSSFFNGSGVSYSGGQISLCKGFYINTQDKRPVGPGKYEIYTSVYGVKKNNTSKVWIRGYEPDSLNFICNYIKQ